MSSSRFCSFSIKRARQYSPFRDLPFDGIDAGDVSGGAGSIDCADCARAAASEPSTFASPAPSKRDIFYYFLWVSPNRSCLQTEAATCNKLMLCRASLMIHFLNAGSLRGLPAVGRRSKISSHFAPFCFELAGTLFRRGKISRHFAFLCKKAFLHCNSWQTWLLY